MGVLTGVYVVILFTDLVVHAPLVYKLVKAVSSMLSRLESKLAAISMSETASTVGK